ncbi:MAG: PEP-CTERM sorting domain-containing protein [Planctomycetota bacterium]
MIRPNWFLLPAALCCAFVASSSHAAIISLTPTDIHNDDTTTSLFSDGDLTLTPLRRDAMGVFQVDTFNGNATRLGIDDNGTNNNAFNDGDQIVGNEGEEGLEFIFSAIAGLESISYDFSRADGPGPDDGVVISGFLADPEVTFSLSNPTLFAVYDAMAGSVRLNIPGPLFSGTVVEVGFTNLQASLGQTLLLTVNDTTQAGAQLAIRGIAYEVVPEPATGLLMLLAAPLALLRRK